MRLFCFIYCLTPLAVVSHPAPAGFIAHDGFNNATNQTIIGQGANANWVTTGQTYSAYQGDSIHAFCEAPDMTPYWGFVTSGNQAHPAGITAPGGTEAVHRNLGASYSTANNGNWFSVLLRVDARAARAAPGFPGLPTALKYFSFHSVVDAHGGCGGDSCAENK